MSITGSVVADPVNRMACIWFLLDNTTAGSFTLPLISLALRHDVAVEGTVLFDGMPLLIRYDLAMAEGAAVVVERPFVCLLLVRQPSESSHTLSLLFLSFRSFSVCFVHRLIQMKMHFAELCVGAV